VRSSGLAAPRTASDRPRKEERAARHRLSVRESVGATEETSEHTAEVDAAEAAMAGRGGRKGARGARSGCSVCSYVPEVAWVKGVS